MREADRGRLRRLLGELRAVGEELPGHKTGLAEFLRRQGREAEAERIEAGPGFSLVDVGAGGVDIISGGRRERLVGGDR